MTARRSGAMGRRRRCRALFLRRVRDRALLSQRQGPARDRRHSSPRRSTSLRRSAPTVQIQCADRLGHMADWNALPEFERFPAANRPCAVRLGPRGAFGWSGQMPRVSQNGLPIALGERDRLEHVVIDQHDQHAAPFERGFEVDLARAGAGELDRQLLGMRLDHLDALRRSCARERRRDQARRALAEIVDIGLEGEAEAGDFRAGGWPRPALWPARSHGGSCRR